MSSGRHAFALPPPEYTALMEQVVAAKQRWKELKKNPQSSTDAKRAARAAYLVLKKRGKALRRGDDLGATPEPGEKATAGNDTVSAGGNKRKLNTTTSATSSNGLNESPTAGKKRRRIESATAAAATKYASFSDAPFCHSIQSTLAASYSAPTAAQSLAWPVAVSGRDVVCIARTGSGKTCAFLLPMLHRIVGAAGRLPQQLPEDGCCPIMSSPVGLVLAPTRELAIQIGVEAVRFGKPLGVRSVCLFGGMPKHNQINSLNGGANAFPHLVVATPGRLLDLCKPQPPSKSKLRRDPKAAYGPPALSLHQVKCMVLDEADRMLDLGFKPQLNELAAMVDGRAPKDVASTSEARTKRQTLCFSATWPQHVCAAAKMFLGPDPVHVEVASDSGRGVGSDGQAFQVEESIAQTVQVLRQQDKERALQKIIESLDPKVDKVIVFSRTKNTCDVLASRFAFTPSPSVGGKRDRAMVASALHSNLPQAERLQVVKDFRSSKIRLLFATDVVARGLDVLDISLVVNYDFPVQRGAGGVEEYVHRIGRTGRAGKGGRAVTFFTDDDAESAAAFLQMLSQSRTKAHIPSELRRMAQENEASEATQMARAKRQAKKEKKKRTKEVRAGDWKCKCGANVFAKKNSCFKCGATKREGERPMFKNVSFS